MEVIQFLERSHFDQLAIGQLIVDLAGFGCASVQEMGWSTAFDGGGKFRNPMEIRAIFMASSLWRREEGKENEAYMARLHLLDENGELGFEPRLSWWVLRDPRLIDEYPVDGEEEAWKQVSEKEIPEDTVRVLRKIIDLGRSLTGQGGDFFK